MMGEAALIWVYRRMVLFSAAVVLLILVDDLGMLGTEPGGGPPAGGDSDGRGGSVSASMTATGRFAAVVPVFAQQMWHEGSGETEGDTEGVGTESDATPVGASRVPEQKISVTARTRKEKRSAAFYQKYKKQLAGAVAVAAAILAAVIGYKKWKGPEDADSGGQAGQGPPQPNQGGPGRQEDYRADS